MIGKRKGAVAVVWDGRRGRNDGMGCEGREMISQQMIERQRAARVWSLIAGRVPGRTDNQVKNHWNTHLSKKLGVKKEITKLGASSQTISTKLIESDSVPMHASSNPPSDSNIRAEEQKVDDNGYQSNVGFLEVEDQQRINESYESPFWFPDDDLRLSTPSLMEILDEYSFDFVWHNL
ncbi:hypothetical protein TEA_002388 [Camellia sinensis var. sinensis]|uniref:Uncharacterized protein n=1 Tax=Camellia sinensis var. sinensis TaxID=542762 RepID=A0A4S4EUB6_CAMSN|nr:hypothetical protein TEA_002388 [Camellia sinensis var. sinensis]